MHLSTLAEWLAWIASIHTKEIELGLERIREVGKRMDVLTFECPVVIVGGTNGKGSTVAGLEAIYRASGRHVGTFTSPILFRHNEQVRVDGENPPDDVFCEAFQQVNMARGDISITPFEFHTLAALAIFKTRKLDVLILEVGLGGRLDAVNIVDPDVAVVTSIGIDHVDYLGPTREHIGFEKAGIFREGRPAVCGDPNPPVSLMAYAQKLGVPLYCQDKEFGVVSRTETEWFWEYMSPLPDLPIPTLALQNMSTVLMTITLLQNRLPVTRENIDTGLKNVSLIGRQQIIPGDVTEIYDVSHNVDSIRWLSEKLSSLPCRGRTYAVFSMLADKDIFSCVEIIKNQIDDWYVAPLKVKRGASAKNLLAVFEEANIAFHFNKTIQDAYLAATRVATAGDRVVIFGSFHTIAGILKNPKEQAG